MNWSSKQSILAAGVDTLNDLSDMVAMTLAVSNSERQERRSAWRASYQHYTPILGVIEPNDSTEESKSDTAVAP